MRRVARRNVLKNGAFAMKLEKTVKAAFAICADIPNANARVMIKINVRAMYAPLS